MLPLDMFEGLPLELVCEIMDKMDYETVRAFIVAYPRYKSFLAMWKKKHTIRLYMDVCGVFSWRMGYV
jgi:hypothetical protein